MARLGGPFLSLRLLFSIAAPAYGQGTAIEGVRECRSDRLRQAAAGFDGRRCFESEQGWFFTADSLWASGMSTALREPTARFRQIFGDSVGRGAILHLPDGKLGPNDSLRKIVPSAAWTWTSPVERENAADVLQGFTGLQMHEMGHGWFDLWSARHGAKDPIAGWMVEAPAILMEDSATTATRYQNLKMFGASLMPLDELFTMANPAIAVADGADMSTENVIRAELFYGACRTLFDFLVARTGDPRVFGAIARDVIKGATMAEWLHAHGARYGLPTTVPDLDEEWRRWLP